jgi:O-antigen ligase
MTHVRERIFLTTLIVAAFCIPMSVRVSTYSLILLSVAWLFCVPTQAKKDALRVNALRLIPFALYCLVLLIGLLYTENYKHGFFQLEKNSAFLVVPLIFGASPKTRKRPVLLAFAAGCCFAMLINITFATIRYTTDHSIENFFYYSLTGPLDFNPIYTSIYLLFSIIIILEFYSMKVLGKTDYVIIVTLLIFLFASLLLLSSKMAYFVSFVILIIASIEVFRQRRRLLLLCGFFLVVIIAYTLNNSFIRSRWEEALSIKGLGVLSKDVIYEGDVNGLTLRLLTWKFGLTALSEKPVHMITGVGTGDTQDFLNRMYEKHNMAITISPTEKYGYYGHNAHNQFMQSYFRAGIFGLLVTIILFWAVLKDGFATQNKLLIAISLVIMFFCITESVLETNKGIVFTCFFLSLLFVNKSSNEDSDLRH